MANFDEIGKELNRCQSIGEMFNYLANYFDLFSKPVPGIYKPMIVSGIVTAIKWINPTLKTKP